MSRFVAFILGAVFVQSAAFVTPGATPSALRSKYVQIQQAEMPQETSMPTSFGAVVMASFVGLMLGLTSTPQMASAQSAPAAAPVKVDSKAKLKAEMEKAQAALQKNAKSKEERLKDGSLNFQSET